ncbi:MAG: hypothetical protein OHK0017_01130 [Patescibacteria group bacterium]
MTPSATPVSWINKKIQDMISYDLEKYSEIPFTITDLAPNVAEVFDDFSSRKLLPSNGNYIIYKEKSLFSREVDHILNRIGTTTPVNVYDLIDTNGEEVIPLIWSLADLNLLNSYVPVTQNPVINTNATDKLTLFCAANGIKDFRHESISANLDLSSFNKQTSIYTSFVEDKTEVTNLFILTNSTLGNFIHPERVLSNIYRSMDAGDYLVILQGIFRPGTEDILTTDYRNISPTLTTYMDIARNIEPEAEVKTTWDDKNINGVRMYFKLKRDLTYAGVDLKSDQEVTLFRSARFNELTLRKHLLEIGFRIMNIAYDDDMDNALFVLAK